MSNDWMDKVFSGAVSPENLEKFKSNYRELKDQSLFAIGVDSLAIMTIVLNIEQITGNEIDVTQVDISDIDTIAKVERYLNGKA